MVHFNQLPYSIFMKECILLVNFTSDVLFFALVWVLQYLLQVLSSTFLRSLLRGLPWLYTFTVSRKNWVNDHSFFLWSFKCSRAYHWDFKKMLSIRDGLSWEVILVGSRMCGLNQFLVRRSKKSFTSVFVSNFRRFKLKSLVNITFLFSLATLFKLFF